MNALWWGKILFPAQNLSACLDYLLSNVDTSVIVTVWMESWNWQSESLVGNDSIRHAVGFILWFNDDAKFLLK